MTNQTGQIFIDFIREVCRTLYVKAGLLTCFFRKRLPVITTVATDCYGKSMKLTAAGLSGICTRFPFNPNSR